MRAHVLIVRLLLSAAACLRLATATWAAQPDAAVLPSSLASDRAGIPAQRQAIAQAAKEQAAACQSRFAVTACLEQVRAQEREALAPWRERELQLNEDSRRDRANARLDAQRRKAQAQARGTAEVQPQPQPPASDLQPREPQAPVQAEPAPHQPPAARERASLAAKQAAATKASAKRAAANQRVKDRVNKRLSERKKPAEKPA